MQREINAVGDEPAGSAHVGVNIARGHEHTGDSVAPAESGRVDDRRHANSRDGDTKRIAVQRLSVVSDAGTGRDSDVTDLHRAAEARRVSTRQCVDHDKAVGLQFAHESAYLRRALHAGRAENAGAAERS